MAESDQQERTPNKLYYYRMNNDSFPPKRMSEGAAGYDLSSCVDTVVPAHGRAVVPTGLILLFPPGCYGRIAPRSGLAVNSFIDVGAGVIDPDYRGETKVVLFNFSDDAFNIRKGDRIAQLILERYETPSSEEIKGFDLTPRGSSGFGASGAVSQTVDGKTVTLYYYWPQPDRPRHSSP